VLKPGAQVGPYEIVAPLRSGGMATLFVANKTGAGGFERRVALKVVHPDLMSDKVFAQLLREEALLTARIRHPNVVHVEQLLEHEGAYVLVMELVNGVSLAELLDGVSRHGRRLSPVLATHIAATVAAALHAAHETRGDDGELLGVVHRDVSPSNVLVSTEGHVKVIDFGVAKARGRLIATGTGDLRGKLAYMAPEQATPRAGVDRRTDVYALGIVLWELLAVERYFAAKDYTALLLVQKPTPRPPPVELPAPLQTALMRALEPDRDARPATAREFRKLLLGAVPEAAILDHEDVRGLVEELAPAGARERTTFLDALTVA